VWIRGFRFAAGVLIGAGNAGKTLIAKKLNEIKHFKSVA
jgi:GTPase SAR1 family protein